MSCMNVRLGDKGQAVKRLQEILDTLGFDGGNNDGIFGPKTESVVKAFQVSKSLKADGIVGPKTWDKINDSIQQTYSSSPSKLTFVDDVAIIDRISKHNHPRLFNFKQTKRIQTAGVIIHQTGCLMPSCISGWDNLNAHIGITRKGQIIIINALDDFIWHAQGLSRYTVGIEIEGNFEGITGQSWTHWKPGGGPHHLNDEQKSALVALEKYLDNWFRLSGITWTNIHAHRQSSKHRVSDPGQEIWSFIREFWNWDNKTDGGPDFQIGSGKALPMAWGSGYKAEF